MAGNDLINLEMKLPEFFKCLGIFLEISKREVAKVFLQNRAGVQNLLLGKVNEDIVDVV